MPHYTPYNRDGFYGFIKEPYFAGKSAANDGYNLASTQQLLQFHNFEEPCPCFYKTKDVMKVINGAETYGTDVTHSMVTGESVGYTMHQYYTDGWFLYYALGSCVTTAASGNYEHTITPERVGTLPSIAIFRQYNNAVTTQPFIMKMLGAQIESYELSWEYTKPLIETIKLRGARGVYGAYNSTFSNTRPFRAPILAAGNYPALSQLNGIYHGGLAVLSFGGSGDYDGMGDTEPATDTRPYTIMGGSVKIMNTLVDIKNTQTAAYQTIATNRFRTMRSVTCTLDVLCADAVTLQEFNDWYLGTENGTQMLLQFTKGANNGLEFYFERIKAENITEVTSAPLRIKITFYGHDKATHLTNKNAVSVVVKDQTNAIDTGGDAWYPFTAP